MRFKKSDLIIAEDDETKRIDKLFNIASSAKEKIVKDNLRNSGFNFKNKRNSVSLMMDPVLDYLAEVDMLLTKNTERKKILETKRG
jgi:hypothetical protein